MPRDVAIFGKGIAKAAVVVDALLGTGVRGALREPIRAAVELIAAARAAGVPIVAVDTPTAVDLSSGEPSDPVVHADLTVTFHRAKTGLHHPRRAPPTPARSSSRRSGSRRRPTVAEPASSGRQPGWREVLLVAVGVVAVVLGLAVVTSVLPTAVQEVVFHTPLLIVVLIVGTGWLLWRVSRRQSGPREP